MVPTTGSLMKSQICTLPETSLTWVCPTPDIRVPSCYSPRFISAGGHGGPVSLSSPQARYGHLCPGSWPPPPSCPPPCPASFASPCSNVSTQSRPELCRNLGRVPPLACYIETHVVWSHDLFYPTSLHRYSRALKG